MSPQLDPAPASTEAPQAAPAQTAPAPAAPKLKVATGTGKTVTRPAKTAKKAAAPKAATKTAKDKSGLRKAQERILKLLAKNTKPMTRKVISEKAPVDLASTVEYLGSHDKAKRLANDEKHFKSLVSLGFVTFGKAEKEGDAVSYVITDKGKQKAATL